MLGILTEVEKDLPKLLMADGWKSLYIDSYPPVVERMWKMWERDPSIRICLHWIHACDRNVSHYHKHPWPLATKLLTGVCWMRVGSSWHFEGEESGPGAVVETKALGINALDTPPTFRYIPILMFPAQFSYSSSSSPSWRALD
jgi:hypothetical protein